MLRISSIRVGALVAGLLGASVVVAYAPPAAAQQDKSADAKKAFEDGKTAYNLGDFDKAIETWKAGYQIKNDPIFLFNVGQAYRQKGDLKQAIYFYKAYMREDPNAPNVADVQKKVDDLQKDLDAQPQPTTTPVQPQQTPQQPPQQPKKEIPLDPGAGKGLEYTGIGIGAAGGALLIVGIVEGLSASSLHNTVQKAVTNGTPWSSKLSSDYSSMKSAQSVAAVGFAAGAVLLVGGGVCYVIGAHKDHAHNEWEQQYGGQAGAQTIIVPSVGPGFAGIAVSGTYW